MLQFVRIGKNVIFSELGKLIFILEAGELAFAYNSESMQAQTTEIHSTKCCKELPELLQVIKGNYSKTVDMEATYKGIHKLVLEVSPHNKLSQLAILEVRTKRNGFSFFPNPTEKM